MSARMLPGVPFAEYRKLPGASITQLRELARSPLHYRYLLDHPRDSSAMSLGRLAHMAILEPDRFAAEVVVWDGGTRRGKLWDAFVVGHEGQTLATRDEYAQAEAMRDAVRASRAARLYLDAGDPEVTMTWDEDGRACRGRLDWLPRDQPAIVGLKTTRNAGVDPFGRSAVLYGYPLQWAHYAIGYEAIAGEVPPVVEIVVESAPPHDVVVYDVGDDVLDIGRQERALLLRRLAQCESENRWPGVASGGSLPLVLPAWAYPRDEDVADLGLTGFDGGTVT